MRTYIQIAGFRSAAVQPPGSGIMTGHRRMSLKCLHLEAGVGEDLGGAAQQPGRCCIV